MFQKIPKIHVGLRTIKTAAAVIIAMIIVDLYGATTSKLIFAMLGAMAAVQPTFKESLESCLTQIVGVFFGAIAGVLLKMLPADPLVCTGIGIIFVITIYNLFHIHFSPTLPCLIVVTICTSADIVPMEYALGRIWDSTIGLGVGMAINSLIFPYDNSRRIRQTIVSLDREVIRFLEEMFDGDDILPDAMQMMRMIDDMAQQLAVFSNQKLLLNLKRQQAEIASFRQCQRKARQLLARMEILSQMDTPGQLNSENLASLQAAGAVIQDQIAADSLLERDIVMNYHVRQILILRKELLLSLGQDI